MAKGIASIRHADEGAPVAPRPLRERQVPAVTRAIAILRLLGKSEAPLGVHAIARELGLVPSTCLHILRVLAGEGLVAFDASTKRYRVAAGILSLARGVLRRNSFSELAQDGLDRLSQRYRLTAIGLQVIGLDRSIVVAIARVREAFGLHVEIGSRVPALISASGRCVAAFGHHDWAEIEHRFRELTWDRPPSWSRWRRDVEETRARGYAVDMDTYVSGVTIVAAPVMTGAGVDNAIVAVDLTERMKRADTAKVGADVVALASELSH